MRKSPDSGQDRQPVFSKSRCSGVVLAFVAAGLFAAAFRGPPPARHQPPEPKLQLSGKAASDYLTQTSDGRSLMQAITAARFGLRWQEHSPGDTTSGGGYLGMSHNQNLNAWFGEEGVTVRSTLPEEKRDQGWSTALRLKAYGYGEQLADVPPIISRQVKDNRIEYERRRPEVGGQKSEVRKPQLTEWYENRAEGIEQGFTLNERPGCCSNGALSPFQARERTPTEWGGSSGPISKALAANEPLRILLTVSGDLRARVVDEGEKIELRDEKSKGGLSYSKLIAQDADGKELGARMEASADGREIMLVVEDANARYPIVIDPIVASLERILDAGVGRDVGAEFGDAVAIDGNRAIVGAWRTDVDEPKMGTATDAGEVFVFQRSGNAWSLDLSFNGFSTNDKCGYSVAISGNRIVYGCAGANSNTGKAYLYDFGGAGFHELIPTAGDRKAGDLYGASVAVSRYAGIGFAIYVGAPLSDIFATDAGVVFLFQVNSDGTSAAKGFLNGAPSPNGQFGTSISTDGLTALVVGAPGGGVGKAVVSPFASGGGFTGHIVLQPSDGAAGDVFGQSVAVSGNTVVVGAGGNDEKGTDAGAAYVFVRDASGQWNQQQKLTASDARAGDLFGYGNPAVAIEGNTIVVGALYQDAGFSDPNDNRGTAYVFTRNITTWTQQTRIRVSQPNGASPGNVFGCAVTMSGDTVIVGAQHAPAFGPGSDGTSNTGAAYVYRLDCVPPGDNAGFTQSFPACPGDTVRFSLYNGGNVGTPPTSFQWRHNGVNIPGATNYEYVLSKVSASDAGDYDVIVSNSCGGAISAPVPIPLNTFNLSPTSQNFGVSGSNSVVNVNASRGACSWTAVSNSPFITINSGASGTGNGTVGFTVAANPDSGQRIGTITIAGLTFTVTQDGTKCGYSIAPTSKSLNASASTNTVTVTTSPDCLWTATSNDPSFLSINSGANGSGNGTVTYTVAANFDAAQRTGALTIAGQTFTVTQTGVPTPTATPGLVGNVSTRLPVGTDDNVLIEGFIVQGPTGSTKKILVRAIGPSLGAFGIADALANPTLEVYDGTNTKVASNNDWKNTQVGGLITGDQSPEISASQLAPGNDLESAIIANLAPGSYTAVVRGAGNTIGTGVVDAYDLSAASPARLANIATRGLIQSGDKLMIAGFIVQSGSVRVVVRAIGPSLTAFGVGNALTDTTLQLRDANGAIVLENDNWKTDQQPELEATGLQPTNDFEAALVTTLQPGQYTAQVRGKNDTSGIGVVQVYFLQ